MSGWVLSPRLRIPPAPDHRTPPVPPSGEKMDYISGYLKAQSFKKYQSLKKKCLPSLIYY